MQSVLLLERSEYNQCSDRPNEYPEQNRECGGEGANAKVARRHEREIGGKRFRAGDASLSESVNIVFGADDHQGDEAKEREQRQDTGERIATFGGQRDDRRHRAAKQAFPENIQVYDPAGSCTRKAKSHPCSACSTS